MNLNQKIAIIGGGYAGMAAAVTLAQRGVAVTVFESAKQLGGRARGVSYQDTQLDNGQHLLLGCYRETLRLIELVGGNIEQDFVRFPLQLELHEQFSLKAPNLPAPLHLLVAFVQAQGLTWADRLKAAGFMVRLQLAKFRLDQLQRGMTDCTVEELMTRYGQTGDLTLKLWEPLCIAALNTPIAQASAQVLLNVLRDSLNQTRADSDMLLPRMNFTALFPQRAAQYVEAQGGKVHLVCGVETLRQVEHGFELTTPQGTELFDKVICATSPSVAARLLRDTLDVSLIAALPQQPIYTVYLQYPAECRLPTPMLGLHQCTSQWLFDKGQIAGQHGLIASVISAEGLHQELSQDQLALAVAAELQQKFAFPEAPVWYKVIAEKRATFSCNAHLVRPDQCTSVSNLWLAGDYTAGDYPATLEGAVMSGVKCAREIS
ncbi:MAG: hydroxysqualene dehydroxylase HpnE [Gallionella sp.]|nr:hydroxysqualene dehydroxylase HpnE [Gallionella sp.]MDD4957893.1 hydroxysqualene dehydroxylase HpnE [Gallionella sp.]